MIKDTHKADERAWQASSSRNMYKIIIFPTNVEINAPKHYNK